MSLGLAERLALQAIIESADPRVSANELLRPIELLAETGGTDDDGALRLARWLHGMSDAERLEAVHGYFQFDRAANESCLEPRSNGGWRRACRPRWQLARRQSERCAAPLHPSDSPW